LFVSPDLLQILPELLPIRRPHRSQDVAAPDPLSNHYRLADGTPEPVLGKALSDEPLLTAIIHEAPVLARGAMFEGPLLLDAHR
jgi:hypothetical protein